MRVVVHRATALLAALCVASSIQAIALAASWPTRPVTIIVPYPAGGGTDLMARAVAVELGDKLGQNFVVENRSGAGGNIGAQAAAKAAPDGYTLLMTTPGPGGNNKFLYKGLQYDPETDFDPVAFVSKTSLVFVTKPNSTARTLADFIAHAKANPGKISIGSAGIGSIAHIASELLAQSAGIKLVHVPYRGGAAVLSDLLGDHIDASFDLISSHISNIQAGKYPALGVTASNRAESLPSVPTIAEQGFPGFEVLSWNALVAPKGTSLEIRQAVNSIVNKYLASPAGRAMLARLDVQAAVGSPADLGAFMKNELAKWGPVIRTAKISMQ